MSTGPNYPTRDAPYVTPATLDQAKQPANENALAAEMGEAMANKFREREGHRLPATDVEFAGMLGIAFLLGRQHAGTESAALVERSVFDAELKALGERMAADGHIVIQRLLYEAEVVGRDKCRFNNWPKHLKAEAYQRLGLEPVEMFRRTGAASGEAP